MTIGRTLRTLRHLKPAQIAARIRHVLRSRCENPRKFAQHAPPDFPGVIWSPHTPFLPPGPQDQDIALAALTFVGQTHAVAAPLDWNAPRASKLWQYNLHYFEYLWKMPADRGLTLMLDWIDRHPLRRGATGWEPYPTSLRLLNWCAYHYAADLSVDDRVWRSVWLQTEWLSRHVETHLRANHLLENAVALAFVGACFDGPDARRWLKKGINLLRAELAEQVLGDGGHYERSPMYQCRVIYALTALGWTGHAPLREMVRGPVSRLLDSLRAMTHPDGGIALLNDAAFGVYNTPAELEAWARRVLDVQTSARDALPETGYFTGRNDAGDYVICDAAPIGPDHQPGHAHADLLSFELSLRGQRVVTDSGVFDYVPGDMRAYCRGTAAHSTVQIAGRDPCEMWGAFRVGRRGRPVGVTYQPTETGFVLSASHDGYRFLTGSPAHHRTWRWHRAGVLLIEDRVVVPGAGAVSRLHLHPDCRVVARHQGWVRVRAGAVDLVIGWRGEVEATVGKSWYCPRFAERVERPVLELALAGGAGDGGWCIAAGQRLDQFTSADTCVIDGRGY